MAVYSQRLFHNSSSVALARLQKEGWRSLSLINILYADEYDLMLLTVQQMLELEGWKVETCRSGPDAWEKIESNRRYDVIILSEKLSGIGGIELLRRTRSLAHRRRTPVLIFASTDCKRQAKAAGADSVLQKPDDIRTLTDVIAASLRSVSEGDQKRVSHSGDNDSVWSPTNALFWRTATR